VSGCRVRRVGAGEDLARALAAVLVDVVEGGASVGFILPLDTTRAEAFWVDVLASAARHERIVLVAEDVDDGTIVGTVQVLLSAPENQPHRGEIAKLQVVGRARRRGIAEALMRAAEDAAREAGKALLVLDTASDTAARLYDRLGWQRIGVIPRYALWPGGGFCDTTIFAKELGPSDGQAPTATAEGMR
jgi:ribosomal protein S18 acetylase RimI-like enzyme